MQRERRDQRLKHAVRLICLVFLSVFTGGVHRSVWAQSCSSPEPIVCENQKTGNPASEWDISGSGDSSIQGFATDISVDRGETVHFKVKTTASAYRLDIYRMGYYGGQGARKVATVQRSSAQNQPNCLAQSSTGLVDCGNWAESLSWAVPTDAISGIYFAKAIRNDNSGASHIFFVVRDDTGRSDILFQTSDTTWQAYNEYGGNSLYVGSPDGRAYKVSYNRPITTRGTSPADFVFNAEYPMVRWLEANGYSVSYSTGVDSDRRGAEILEHKVYLSNGHDEYWSGNQRSNVEAARAAGVHLGFFSGNEIFWKTRWETSIDGSGTPYRTLVCYKETHADAVIDPADPPTWTGTWMDPRFSPPADGGRPGNALAGTLFRMNDSGTDYTISVPYAYSRFRFWRNTTVANLSSGQTASLAARTLGYEWDDAPADAFQPAGLMRLSSTTITNNGYLQDWGSNYGPGTATHSLTLYKHSSGALVFGTGTVQWSWGLDGNHDRSSSTPDVRMQQATVNLFADMGVQPHSLRPGLVAASASTDATPPASVITSPQAGANFPLAGSVTITGTASDSGGLVTAVDVSTDGGTTWQRANGTTSWSYVWSPMTAGNTTIRSRAADDSGNLETPSAGVTVTVGGTQTCPCTIWPSTAVPAVPADPDTSSVELGVKFQSDVNGSITGIRFYKGSGNTGTHIGNLWTTTGTRLATATFTNETASGWQQVLFSAPVAITANTTYMASYFAPVGRYAVDDNYFSSQGVTNPPLRALSDSAAGGNGVYLYTSTSAFPNQTYAASNYWVDVVFTPSGSDTTPPTITSVTPVNGATAVSTGTTVTAVFSEAMDASTVNTNTFELRNAGTLVTATVSYNTTTRTATLTPSAALSGSTTYTATIKGGSVDPRVKDVAGNALAANFVWSFTTAASDTTPPTVTSVTPTNGATGVSSGTTVTAVFSEAMDATTISTNTFSLRNGSTLVTATVSYNATTRTGTLTPSAALAGSTTYTATVKGGAVDPRVKDVAGNAMAADFVWSFTTAAADTTPPTVTSVTPANGATGVSSGTTVTAVFSEAMDATTISTSTFELRNGSTLVTATVSYNATTRTATLTPSAALAGSTSYTATVKGGTVDPRVKDLAGNALAANFVWSFTTAASSRITIWPDTAIPGTPADPDTVGVELGVKFQSDVSGYILGIRFYKGPGNTGTHTGSLWTAGGTRLATVTFTNETASGWQQMLFSKPVAITANTTYVASYFAPVGRYAYDENYFASQGVTNPPLRALMNGVSGGNGVYRYTNNSRFPNQTYNSSNYWVDVIFSQTGN